jgi:hypothetical protein
MTAAFPEKTPTIQTMGAASMLKILVKNLSALLIAVPAALGVFVSLSASAAAIGEPITPQVEVASTGEPPKFKAFPVVARSTSDKFLVVWEVGNSGSKAEMFPSRRGGCSMPKEDRCQEPLRSSRSVEWAAPLLHRFRWRWHPMAVS